MLLSLSKGVLAASLAAMALSLWLGDRLPERSHVLPELRAEPAQVAVDARPFTASVGGITYTVRPLYRYEIGGLVVSRHDASAWWDVVHRKFWQDRLNVVDLCLVWGSNLASDVYRRLHYWSEVFTCNVATESDADWRSFEPDALSNNHLLAAEPRLVKLLRGVRPGDQVRVTGYLAEYSHDHGQAFRRGTSTVRTDRGDGACETVWVVDAEVLRAANRGWRLLMPLALCGIALAFVLWWLAPARLPED